MAGIGILSICGDGAPENVAYFEKTSTDPLSKWLCKETIELFEKAGLREYLEIVCTSVDKVMGLPTWILEDMPHLIKRLVNAMDRSSDNKESRNLMYGLLRFVFDLMTLRNVWWAMGGASNQLAETKLTPIHFEKSNWDKMRVGLAMQCLSDSVVKMLEKACSCPEILEVTGHDAAFYQPMIQLATHVNRLVDIVNGRDPMSNDKANFTPETGREIQKELINILKWFGEWKKLNDMHNLGKEAFIAPETWNGLKRMILGYIGIIDYYVIRKGISFSPRKSLSDPCEHLFSRLRQMGGSTNTFNAKDAVSFATNEDILNQCRGENVCYGGINAEPAVGRHTKIKGDKRKIDVGNQFNGRVGRNKKVKHESRK